MLIISSILFIIYFLSANTFFCLNISFIKRVKLFHWVDKFNQALVNNSVVIRCVLIKSLHVLLLEKCYASNIQIELDGRGCNTDAYWRTEPSISVWLVIRHWVLKECAHVARHWILIQEHSPRFMIHSRSLVLSSLTAHNSQVTPHTDVIQYHIEKQSDWMTPCLLRVPLLHSF